MQSILQKMINGGQSFLAEVEKSDGRFFSILFLFFFISSILFQIGWKSELINIVWKVYFVLFAAVMWGSAIYLFQILVSWRNAWKRTGEIILIGIVVFVVTGILSKLVTTDSYKFVMGTFFCIMACGKNYRRMVRFYLIGISSVLVLGYVLMQLDIAFDAAKPYRAYGGHSLGILYPNNWGFLVFAVMILVWYLYLQERKIVTVVMFWVVAVFMYKYITCMTIAAMAVLFPVVAIAAEMMQEKKKRDHANIDIANKDAAGDTNSRSGKIWKSVIISLPFLSLAVMLIFCWQMDWVHDTFYNTKFESMAMRFVEGGYALRLGGVSLFGHPFSQMRDGIIDYLSDIDMKIDSAFVTYLIIRGLVAMAMTLGWIAYVHKKCLERKDYRLLVISIFMLLFSTMERPGLDVWYNFVLVYPLAAIAAGDNNLDNISKSADDCKKLRIEMG